jgi:hypothetical protein
MAAETKKKSGNETSPERQALIMWALLARENAGAFQYNDLKPKPSTADRNALEKAGLIEHRKVGQKIWLEVTDKGWSWASENLGHALPKKSDAGAEILRGWLVKLNEFLSARGFALADVLGSQPAPSAPVNGHAGHKPIVAPSISLRDRIRAAYLDATGGRFNKRALLKDIRASLADVERATLDEALTKMQREDAAVLYPLDNRAEITDADRAAAISFAGEPRHILWIER